MRKIAAVLMGVLVSAGVAGPALAHSETSPAGSTWSGGQVACGHSETFLDAPVVLYNGYRGLEVCSEALGRVWLQSNRDEPIALPNYIHWDWDEDGPLSGQGHVELPF